MVRLHQDAGKAVLVLAMLGAQILFAIGHKSAPHCDMQRRWYSNSDDGSDIKARLLRDKICRGTKIVHRM